MGSPMCDHCNMTRAVVHCETHLARFCFQCDLTLHYVTVDSPDHSRFLLCNNCTSQTATVQCHDQGLSLCQKCFSNANDASRILLCNVSSNNSGYSFSPLFDIDSSSSSSSSSFIDLDWVSPFVPLPLSYGDSSSSIGIFQNFDNYTKNSIDHRVQKLQPDYLDVPKDSSCSGFDCYESKEIENICLINFDDYKAVFDLKECFTVDELILTDQLIDKITKHNADTKAEVIPSLSSGVSSVTHKDYNTEALANASCEDYKKNQMICSKAKEEIHSNVEIFHNADIHFDCGPSQLTLTDVHDMSLWDDQTPASRAYDPQARLEALKRYFAKKEKRKFGKQIRYESRKSTADTKRRLKGRFTKAGADYDYDPRANNNNKETNKFMT
ncbi:putative zinc finger protein CONSTANS-LIKE 11 isoform X2 [Raphanus sativus]|uniref:Zinc finger protein CONSTANS-LIKE 11 isoform X2 n=1 Tax=Raphanus sativus TaxID=3726 RepID=A0A6J0NT43_RAPSA|nr:putative zinc finger protein CONSTANS-LIKE 11 isoform X2 [Raphanus sativus]